MSENSNVTDNVTDKMTAGTPGKGIDYKWVALFNVTLSSLMGTINGSIILISLPAIFNGIQLNPMAPDAFQYLIWVLMGYGLVTATILLSIGRLADMYGRVRLFRLGFLIFTIGSILLYLTPDKGSTGAMELIVFRLVQAVGGAFTMANGAAIITDVFPAGERGKALGHKHGCHHVRSVHRPAAGRDTGGIQLALRVPGQYPLCTSRDCMVLLEDERGLFPGAQNQYRHRGQFILRRRADLAACRCHLRPHAV